MSKPTKHAISSVKRFGGIPEDYEPIHEFLDSSKGAIPTSVHRTLTHNSWFLMEVLPRVRFPNSGPMSLDFRFPTIINSDGKEVNVRDIGEVHCAEDFGMKFIPTVQDYLEHMEIKPWMVNGMAGMPSSMRKISEKKEININLKEELK